MLATYPTIERTTRPALRLLPTRRPVTETHCVTGESVPAGTCPCWKGARPGLLNEVVDWMHSFRERHPEFA